MIPIKERKADHIGVCLEERIAPGHCYWDDIKLIHNALPEVNTDEIDTKVTLFGKTLDFPLIVTAITGGFPGAKKINENIAKACSDLGIGMGVGSERAGVNGIDKDSYSIVKDYDIPLVIGNVGAPQLIPQHSKDIMTHKHVECAMSLIDADVLAIHLNFLQEIVQPEGDTNAKGCYDAIRDVAANYPTIVKETGAGISADVANLLKGTGILGIDIAGMGGTSFAAVEMYRAMEVENHIKTRIGETFFDWGIPSPASLICTKNCIKNELPIIASGGILDGLHVASAISMGADCAGVAHAVLREATESADAVKNKLILIKEELKVAMLLTGSQNIKQLSTAKHIVLGETKEWIEGLS